MSIDTSRKVRQSAHTIQGYIVSVSGKKVARQVPKVIGAWLAGLYDNDKLVLRAAQDSMIRAFPTEGKRSSIWKVYQSAIVEFVLDAVLEQTPSTLSDERTVKPDDAQAKHARVVATALQVLSRLICTWLFSTNWMRDMLTRKLARADSKDLEKEADSLRTLFKSKTLWQLSNHDDPFVRRSVYSLLQISLSLQSDPLDWDLIATHVLSKSLPLNQYGSASEFSELLLALTKKQPQIWTSHYHGKTSATKRLYQYIRNGSQGAIAFYWQNLHRLLQLVPLEIILAKSSDEPVSLKYANDLMEAIHDGVASRDEQRMNVEAAWSCFIDTAFWMTNDLLDPTVRREFLDTHISPIVKQYVIANTDESRWTLHNRIALNLVSNCVVSLGEYPKEVLLKDLWIDLSEFLANAIKLSPPEQSQSFRIHQDVICSQLSRFFDLESSVLARVSGHNNLSSFPDIFDQSAIILFEASIQVLRSRNGKPYCAASMIDEALARVPSTVTHFEDLENFLAKDIPELLLSPSSEQLISVLFRCRDQNGFKTGLSGVLRALRDCTSEGAMLPALRKVFSSVAYEDVVTHPDLIVLVDENLDRALRGSREAWVDVVTVLNNNAFHGETEDRLISTITDNLSSENFSQEALYGLSRLRYENPQSMRKYANGQEGSKLISKLLLLAESPVDEVAQLSESLEKEVKDIMKGESGVTSLIDIVQSNFRETSINSLS